MKRTLLDDFMKIYHNINCDSLYCNCNDCSNKGLYDLDFMPVRYELS